MTRFLLYISILTIFANTALANCPSPQSISYQCQQIKGHRMCTWGPDNGWYQGNADENPVKDGERLGVNAFKQAVWYPYEDDNHGATRCLYVGPFGETVNLFQQTGYGNVPAPEGSLWRRTSMEGFPYALECSANASTCKFEFGE